MPLRPGLCLADPTGEGHRAVLAGLLLLTLLGGQGKGRIRKREKRE